MAAKQRIEVFKTKTFARFAQKARVSDHDLWLAAQRANKGLIDADLGGGVIKQRIARAGEGKSGGSRSIVLFRKEDRAVFVYGFEKKERANIKPDELQRFQALAKIVLDYTSEQMAQRVEDGEMFLVRAKEGSEDGKEVPEQDHGRNP